MTDNPNDEEEKDLDKAKEEEELTEEQKKKKDEDVLGGLSTREAPEDETESDASHRYTS